MALQTFACRNQLFAKNVQSNFLKNCPFDFGMLIPIWIAKQFFQPHSPIRPDGILGRSAFFFPPAMRWRQPWCNKYLKVTRPPNATTFGQRFGNKNVFEYCHNCNQTQKIETELTQSKGSTMLRKPTLRHCETNQEVKISRENSEKRCHEGTDGESKCQEIADAEQEPQENWHRCGENARLQHVIIFVGLELWRERQYKIKKTEDTHTHTPHHECPDKNHFACYLKCEVASKLP